MNCRLLLNVLVGALMSSLVATAATAQAPPPQAPPPQAVFSDITVRGTVESLDVGARTVRIRGDQGNLITLDVPASYTRFNQVKVGDVVTITYSDRMTIKPHPAGEPAVDRSTPLMTPTPGLAPGGTRVTERVTTASIDAWDPTTKIVTFTTPGGQYTRRMAETTDPALTAGLKVGDRVDVTRTEAMSIAVTTPAPPPAAAPTQVADTFKHRATISVLYGPDSSTSGDIAKSGSGTFQGTPISFNDTSFDNVYGTVGLLKIGFGYRTSPRTEVNLNYVYSSGSSQEVQVGTVGTANDPLSAKFDDYKYWGFEGGQRFYFARVRATPFLGYTVGINKFSAIGAAFSSPPIATTQPIAGNFFDSSWELSTSFNGGLLIGLGPIEFMAEAGFRYMGSLAEAPPLAEPGLADINSDSKRWSIPVLFGVRLRF